MLNVLPQLVANDGLRAIRAAIAEPSRFAIEPKIDVQPAPSLAEDMAAGLIEGILLKDRRSTYRDGSRAGWSKLKDRGWHEREAWRFTPRKRGVMDR